MTTNVSISVITAVYNGEKYIQKCVQSILNQTFTDFEYIIVDDGSTDHTVSILTELAKHDKRITVLTQKNAGPAAARNTAIHSAKGNYIAIQDSDDISLPDRLQNQFDQLTKSAPNIISCTGYYLIDEEDQIFATHNKIYEDINANILQGNTSICHPTIMAPRSAIQSVGGYNPFYAKTEDYDLIIRLIEHNFRFQKLNQCLFSYRIRANSESSITSDAYIKRIYENYNNRLNNRPENLSAIINTAKMDDNYVLKRQLREIFYTENYTGFLSLYTKHMFKLPFREFIVYVFFSISPFPVKKILKTLYKRKK